MQASTSTRFSKSMGVSQELQAGSCLLVRIYPVNSIEKPIAINGDAILIGREEQCSLRLQDDSVSRRHAIIESLFGRHVIADLGSTNGTFVNESPLKTPHTLVSGDRIRFGNQIYKYLTSDRIETQYHEVMFNMMTSDGLTSLHNKRYFMDTLDREIALSHRSESDLCVMMMDLDRFKFINDTFGHLAGDAVLVEFAQRAKSVLRSGELLARYGGEEFVLLLTRTSLNEAIAVAGRVRQIVAETPFRYRSIDIPVTVSIGVCNLDRETRQNSCELIAVADALLYDAKESGRNRVCSQTQMALVS